MERAASPQRVAQIAEAPAGRARSPICGPHGGRIGRSNGMHGPVNGEVPATPRPPDAELKIPEIEGRNRVWRVALVLLVLGGLGAVLAYRSGGKTPTELYRTVPVSRRTLVQVVEAAGRVDVRKRVDVPAPVAGLLLSVHVQEGDTVEAGQLLAELDGRALTLAVRGAQAQAQAAAGGLAQARSRLKAAERALGRAEELLTQGLASREEVDAARSGLAQAKAALQAAQGEQRVAGEQVASARLTQGLSRIESPIAGVVLRAPERIGALASPESGALFVLGEPLSTMRVDAHVSETEVALVEPGKVAEILVAALPGESFEGRVERVGIESERRDGAVLYPIRLSVDNPEKKLLPGMTARARIEIARAENVLSVHEAALRFTPEGVEPAQARRRVFRRTGPDSLESVTVKSPLSDGFHAQIEAEAGASIEEGDRLVVGLMDPGDSKKPSISLGKKK